MNRVAAAWGVVAAAATVALTGCDKPNPGVSVWSGTNSEHRSALCWSFDPAVPIDDAACARDLAAQARDGARFAQLSVINGNTVGISVDPVVADHGWIPAIGSQALAQEPIFSTYWRFTFPDFERVPNEGLELQVRALSESDGLRGLWVFQLKPHHAAAE